jgi:hypothetical protein
VPLRKIGLSPVIAPSHPVPPSISGFRGTSGKAQSFFHYLLQSIRIRSGGIAGGGILEFDWEVAKKVLPLSLIYIGKVVLSNLSFAYVFPWTMERPCC